MNTSPHPARRPNNLNGRSRSPSPATHDAHAHAHAHNAQPPTAEAKDNFLNPGNANLLRVRRSSPTENSTGVAETIPLIETTRVDSHLAVPETDDSEDDRQPANGPYPGVDDGFFSNRLNPDGEIIPGTENAEPVDETDAGVGGKRIVPSRGTTPRIPMSPTYPYGPDNKPMFPDLEIGTNIDLESIPDINVYQHKKTLAQGMMDLALFSANANQLRYVLESDRHPYYYPGIVLISISLVLQVAIGVGLIWNSRYNVKDDKEICIANKINNFTIIGIFLVTVVNVFISAFGVASVQPVVAAAANNP